jgi:hypothetical protein
MAAWAIVPAACAGPAEPSYQSAKLAGQVTVDGQPIESGTIQFVPKDPGTGPITQALVKDGRYVADKVPIGKVTAIISASPAGPTEPVTSDYQPPKWVGIPSRYASGFPIEVKEDKSDQDFSMSSKGSGSGTSKPSQRS